jgi:transposase
MIKEVLRLHHSCRLSNTKISKALGCSRGAVAEYLHRAKAAGLSWPLPEELDDAQIEQRLFPQSETRHKPLPDFDYVHRELKKKGVTLVQLWAEYREDHPDGYGLSHFCELYGLFRQKLNLVMRMEHKAGEKCFSDFAGKTLPIVIDQRTGQRRDAHLFVCTLGASSLTFADLFWDESTESWCNGHAAAFQYFDGCPEFVVPDNPKPVVTKACPYEPDINPSFAQMAAHYDVVVTPARVRRPKDKAKVEAAVGLATRWILAVLRNRTFFSLAEARVAVRELLDKLNDRPFKKIPGSRRSLYESLDRPALKPLPVVPYEYSKFKKASVNVDYHIVYDNHYYSVPYQFRGEVVEVRATASTVEVFRRGKRIASHPRGLPDHKASTITEHRPKNHQEYGEWPPERILNWARKIGPYTAVMAETIMGRKDHPELGYRSCLGILRLAKKFGESRLEAACQRAVAIRGFSCKSVRSILESNLDQRPLPEKSHQLSIVHSNVRGSAAFTLENKENSHANTSNHRNNESHEAHGHGEGPGSANGTEGGS